MRLMNFLMVANRVLLAILLGSLLFLGEALAEPPLFSTGKEESGPQPLDDSAIASHLENQMQKALGDEKKTVRVREIQGLDKVTLPSSNLSWEARVPDRFYQGGTISVSLIFQAKGERVREVRIQARVEIYGDVVMSKTGLRRHQVVEEKDLQVVNRNITSLPGDVATSLEDVVGRRMTLSVNPQEILRRSMVEVPPLVKRGDRVTLLVENDYFKITSMGEAKEDGRSGDRIKVVNISSQKEVYGRVIDAQTIQVNY